jgi:hypothetical protein
MLSSALGVKGLKKDGTPRVKREYNPSEAQTTWNSYVQEVREEHGYLVDEEGEYVLDKKGQPKLALSYKDAMQIASERRKTGYPGAPPLAAAAPKATAASSAVRVVAKPSAAAPLRVVSAAGGGGGGPKTVVAAKPSAAAAPAVRKTAAELRAEYLAKKAAEAEAAAAAAAEAEAAFLAESAGAAAPEEAEEVSNEAVEWSFGGKTYFKTGDNLCWEALEDGERLWAGVYLPAEDRIDDSAEEPVFDEE